MNGLGSDLFYEGLLEDYIKKRRFTPRPWLAERITKIIDKNKCRYLLLTAEPGAGKTAFAAWQAQQNSEWLRYFIRRDSQAPLSSGDVRSFLLTLGHQLATLKPALFEPENQTDIVKQRIGTVTPSGNVIGLMVDDLVVSPFYTHPGQVEQDVDKVEGTLIGMVAKRVVSEQRLLEPHNLLYLALLNPAAALAQLEPKTRLVVLVDALDEMRYQAQADTLLSNMATWPPLPENLRIVLTSRPDKGLLSVFRQRQAEWLEELEINPGEEEVEKDLRGFVSAFTAEPPIAKALEDHKVKASDFVDGAAKRADGNFQYAAALARAIDAAMNSGASAGLDKLLKLDDVPVGLEPLYAYFIRQVRSMVGKSKVELIDPQSGETEQQEAWGHLYQPVMGVLAAAQTPLPSERILEFSGLVMETRWLNGALLRLDQFLDPVDGGYRFYHTTLREFLVDPATRQEYDDCYLAPAEWHRKIADALLKACGKDWLRCKDDYALQYTPVHLIGAAGGDGHPALRPTQLRRLYNLAYSNDYAQAYLQRYRLPGRLLRFLQDSIRAALEADDLPEAWRLTSRYQSMLIQQRDFARLVEEVQAGDLQRALERSGVYSGQPNAQALAQMWIAWLAARAGNKALAEEAARMSLNTLQGQIASLGTAKKTHDVTEEAKNKLEVSLRRTLRRCSERVTGKEGDARGWYDGIWQSYKSLDALQWQAEFERDLDAWVHDFDSVYIYPEPIGNLIDLERTIVGQSGEQSMEWREVLCAILARTLDHSDWPEFVQRAVRLISLDDYPSYREMALAWLATATLAQPDEDKAQKAMQVILAGMLSGREPELPEDAKAIVLGCRLAEAGKAGDAGQMVEALRQGLSDQSESQAAKDAMGGRGRNDPWAWDVRRANAIAGALARLGHPEEAKSLLIDQATQEFWQSFAGYRCLAYLAVALRWLELGKTKEAKKKVTQAKDAANKMLDEVIKSQRLDLIREVSKWLRPAERLANQAEAETQAETMLRQAATLGGALRSFRLQFLSALWRDDPRLLKKLLPLALDDPAGMDAILGRLLGALASQMQLQDEALERLASEMKLA
jgi:hypothetical protein